MAIEVTLPLLADDLVVSASPTPDGRHMVELTASGRTFFVKPAQYTILVQMQKGTASTIPQLVAALAFENGLQVSPAALQQFVEKMRTLGITADSQSAATSPATAAPGHVISIERWAQPVRIAATILFDARIGLPLTATALVGLVMMLWLWHDAYIAELRWAFAWPQVWVAYAVIYCIAMPLLVFIHEGGHEMAALKFLGSCFPVRVSLMPIHAAVQLSPAAVWNHLANTRQRIALALAGLYVQVLAVDLLILGWHTAIKYSIIGMVCCVVTIPLLCGALLDFMPGLPDMPGRKTDGYFVISYAMALPNLAVRLREYRSWARSGRLGSACPTWVTSMAPLRRAALPYVAMLAPWLDPVVRLAVTTALVAISWPVPVTGRYVASVFFVWFTVPYVRCAVSLWRQSRFSLSGASS